jgi:hypothetical protein
MFSDEPPGLGLETAQSGCGQRVVQHEDPKRSKEKQAAVGAAGAWGAPWLSAVGGGGGGGGGGNGVGCGGGVEEAFTAAAVAAAHAFLEENSKRRCQCSDLPVRTRCMCTVN